jgi:hypothetical protein
MAATIAQIAASVVAVAGSIMAFKFVPDVPVVSMPVVDVVTGVSE